MSNRVKAHKPSDSQQSLFKRTAEATDSSLSTVRRIVKQKDGPKTPGKKRPNEKEQFNKLDEFDLGIMRRIVHIFYQNNETFSLRKLLNKLREKIKFLYSTTSSNVLLKKLGFRYKKRQRESIIHERPDLVSWRETFFEKNQGNQRK